MQRSLIHCNPTSPPERTVVFMDSIFIWGFPTVGLPFCPFGGNYHFGGGQRRHDCAEPSCDLELCQSEGLGFSSVVVLQELS